jgi:hypothetical protein
LYGLTGRPSVHPSIFYCAGLGSPLLNTPTFQSYETQLLRNMKQHQVRYVILEGDRTQMNSGLEDFNLLSKRVKQQACNEQQFGRFRVIELCDKEK